MPSAPELLAIARNLSDLAPYVGRARARLPDRGMGPVGPGADRAILIGLLLIMLAVGAFILEHASGGSSGVPGVPGG